MPCEILEKVPGCLTVKISGKLRKAELAQAEQTAAGMMRTGGKMRFLLLTQDFRGWEDADEWGDVSFQTRYDAQIERIAIVGEKRWQELAEVFMGKGLRSVNIRYFTPSQEAVARVWVKQKIA